MEVNRLHEIQELIDSRGSWPNRVPHVAYPKAWNVLVSSPALLNFVSLTSIGPLMTSYLEPDEVS